MMIDVIIEKVRESAIIPTFGSADAAGCDLYANIDKTLTIEPGITIKIPTGIKMALPNGYFGGIFARSGLATKEGLRPANCVGVVDSDYRGEIIVALYNDSDRVRIIAPQQRIAQMVLLPCQQMNFIEGNLDETERGSGGFGSTGKQ